MLKIGDYVDVLMYSGYRAGVIKEIIPNYTRCRETKYLIHGDNLVTISSSRLILKKDSK